MELYLHPDLQRYFSRAKPLFDQIMALSGERFRHQEGRITQRVILGGQDYFIKQHFGVGYKEMMKNLIQGRLPIISAKNEWMALIKLNALNIGVPRVVGYGQRGVNPARLQSFVLMESLLPATSLEAYCLDWPNSPPSTKLKYRLIRMVAEIVRTMHENGMNHRDCYLCHFLLKRTLGGTLPSKLHIIDLHRAGMRKLCRPRWAIKDLAGLYFSSKDIGLTRRDLYRFMKIYRQKGLRQLFTKELDFWLKILLRGEKLYHDHGK